MDEASGSGSYAQPSTGKVRDRIKRWKRSIVRHACSTVQPTDADSVVDGGDLPVRVPSLDELSILSRSILPQGKVIFWKEFEYEQQGHPYVRVTPDTPIPEVQRLLEHDWKMTVPTIVLDVITNVKRSVFWEGHRQWANLQRGLIEAANKTEMWILTHGLNNGVAKMLGDIVQKEVQRREAMTCYRHPKQSGPKLPRLTLMGVVNSDLLEYDDLLDGKSHVEVENTGNRPQENMFELNPDHTHFIVVKDPTSDGAGVRSFGLELKHFLRSTPSADNVLLGGVPLSGQSEKPRLGTSDIPVIALLIGGGNRCTLTVLAHLKKHIPVVVVKGSGGAADLLAFAYEEIKGQSRGTWDPDYVETFIMSELSKKIAVQFEEYRENNLARNKFRDRILECVRYSSTDDRVFLSFLDINSLHICLSDLDQHLLRALFKAEARDLSDYNWYHHLQKDLRLTLDWNCPDIAASEVFAKNTTRVKVEKKVFEQALLRQDRETFVELFLDQGFQIHKFLTEKRLTRLFEKAENPEFFRNVCLEEALGYSFSLKLDREFLKRDLNWLIHYLTKLKNFIEVHDLTSNAMGTYTCEPPIAERRAHHALVVWSVLMNRPKLARVLWKRSDYPIHMALLISLLYSKLVAYVKEKHLSKELEDRSKEFADMAIGVLDTSFQASNCRAFDILSEEIPDFNCKTAVELAAVARNRKFIAHPCCQKWLTYLFHGDIRIRELKFGPFTIAPWIKVILSAFLVFPMYFWIHFKTGAKRSVIGIYDDGESDEGSDVESDVDTISQPPLSRMCSREGRKNSFPLTSTLNNAIKYEELPTTSEGVKKSHWHLRRFPQVTFLQYLKPRPQPAIWDKIYVMWNAPITKFWTHQIFYILYLALFSLTVLWPSAGNFWLDVAVFFWTLLIHVENVRVTYIQYKKYSSIPLVTRTLELVMINIFLVLFLVFRILQRNEYTPFDLEMPHMYISPYTARVIMCLGLLYFYYRFIWIYFPISPTLGPLLFRIRLMVTDDFVHFLRLALLFIISSGIVIHSVIYPDYPITKELLRRVFHKAWFTLFLTPIGDLEEEQRCMDEYKNPDEQTDLIGKYQDFTCPNTGAWPYIMTIQYHIILKLILLTLLYALFSDTAATTASDADSIWRYQRYHLVLDFSARMRLPAPLSAFSFLLSLLETLFKGVTCRYCKKAEAPENAELLRQMRQKANDHNYWRSLAAEYIRKEEDKEQQKKRADRQGEGVTSICENLEFQKGALYKLKVRLTELEKIMLTNRISLEEIKHGMTKEDVRISGGITIHLLSRSSPYFGTRVQRFPLADKYVPWEVLYSIYDPVVYSQPKTEFSASIRESVDEDLLLMREQQGTIFKPPDLKWNFVFTNVAGITIDRTSWITKADEAVIYKLDSAGLPVNPMGRTGLRGRGSLYRWGPNHCVLLVITRWRLQDGFLKSVQGASVTDEQKVLEFVIYRQPGEKFLTMPGGFLHGDVANYNLVRKQFLPDSMEKWDVEKMQKYFMDIAISQAGDFVDIVGEEAQMYDFEATCLLRGYMDHTKNTDNAWVEAEIWQYHYTASQCVDLSKLSNMRWKKLTPNLSDKMLPSHAALLSEVQQRMESS